jgi:branched-chain amino acid transport system substrate-binding protein
MARHAKGVDRQSAQPEGVKAGIQLVTSISHAFSSGPKRSAMRRIGRRTRRGADDVRHAFRTRWLSWKARGGHVLAAALGISITVGSAQAADPIEIGAIYSLTGTYRVTEAPALKAARLALRQINDSGGIRGRPIELIHIDGKSSEAAVVAATRQLVHRAGVVAIIGVFDSAFFRASAGIAQNAGIPYICTGGTQPDLPALIGPFAHMMAFGDDQQAYVAATFAARELGAETAFVLYNAALNYTRGAAGFFKERFKQQGGVILGEWSYLSGDTDYQSFIDAVLGMEQPPDVVYAAMNPGEAGSFVRPPAIHLDHAIIDVELEVIDEPAPELT